MWSDSSWSKYGKTEIINGITYVSTINSLGNEYYYDAIGYAGFKPNGNEAILFDKSFPGFPDSIHIGDTFIQESSFFSQGYNYHLKFEYLFEDTNSVSIPIGIFNKCLQISSKTTLTVLDQKDINESTYWLAIGPGNIKNMPKSGLTTVLVRARVNGLGWGMPYPKDHFAKTKVVKEFKLFQSIIPISILKTN